MTEGRGSAAQAVLLWKTPLGSQSKLPLLVQSSDVPLEAGLLEVSCQSK